MAEFFRAAVGTKKLFKHTKLGISLNTMAALGLCDGCSMRFCGGASEQVKASIAYAFCKLLQAA